MSECAAVDFDTGLWWMLELEVTGETEVQTGRYGDKRRKGRVQSSSSKAQMIWHQALSKIHIDMASSNKKTCTLAYNGNLL